jgi:hypothetical protein
VFRVRISLGFDAGLLFSGRKTVKIRNSLSSPSSLLLLPSSDSR